MFWFFYVTRGLYKGSIFLILVLKCETRSKRRDVFCGLMGDQFLSVFLTSVVRPPFFSTSFIFLHFSLHRTITRHTLTISSQLNTLHTTKEPGFIHGENSFNENAFNFSFFDVNIILACIEQKPLKVYAWSNVTKSIIKLCFYEIKRSKCLDFFFLLHCPCWRVTICFSSVKWPEANEWEP